MTGMKRSGGLRPRRKTRKGQVAISGLDVLWRVAVKTRDKFQCQNPECEKKWPQQLEAAHFVSKKYYGTRWDIENGVTLCGRCHALTHDSSGVAMKVFGPFIGLEKCDWLWVKARAAVKIDRHKVREHLKSLLSTMEGNS